eukprot:7673990-Pyramimonas_sp.AAC.1
MGRRRRRRRRRRSQRRRRRSVDCEAVLKCPRLGVDVALSDRQDLSLVLVLREEEYAHRVVVALLRVEVDRWLVVCLLGVRLLWPLILLVLVRVVVVHFRSRRPLRTRSRRPLAWCRRSGPFHRGGRRSIPQARIRRCRNA